MSLACWRIGWCHTNPHVKRIRCAGAQAVAGSTRAETSSAAPTLEAAREHLHPGDGPAGPYYRFGPLLVPYKFEPISSNGGPRGHASASHTQISKAAAKRKGQ